MTRRRPVTRETPLAIVIQATAAYVVIVVASLYFLVLRSDPGPLGPLLVQLRPINLVFLVLFGLVLTYKWRVALTDHRATRAAFRNREQLAALSPEQFERWCQARLEEAGYRTKLLGGQADHGVDLEAERDGQLHVVQCKRYAGRRLVGEPQLRDLYGAMHARNADGAIVITAGSFTNAAKRWADGKPVELWDIDRLAHLGAVPPTTAVASAVSSPLRRTCPECGAVLTRRRNRRTQEEFLGCSTFPRCRFTSPIR